MGSTTKEFVPHGYGEWKENGAAGVKYVGGFKNGVQHGPGIIFYANGSSKLGQWFSGALIKGFQSSGDGTITLQQFTPAGDCKAWNATTKKGGPNVTSLQAPDVKTATATKPPAPKKETKKPAPAKDAKSATPGSGGAEAVGGADKAKSSPVEAPVPVPVAEPAGFQTKVTVKGHKIKEELDEYLSKVLAIIAANTKAAKPK